MKAPILFLGCLALVSLPALGGGAEWRKLPFSEPEAVHGLCGRGDSLWAAFDGGVRVSPDGGAAWSETGTGFRPGKVVGVAAGSRRLAAVQARLIYLSDDGGRTWYPQDSLEAGTFYRMDAWDDTLFAWYTAFGTGYPSPQGIRFSADEGSTWNALSLDIVPMPKPRIFASDTLSFASGTLYRVNSDGPKVMSSFPGPIQEVAAAGKRLFVLSENLISRADHAEGPWTRIITRDLPGVVIQGVAADSDAIAVQTAMGISLSRNRGRDWEFLRTNFAPLTMQTLHLGDNALYVRLGGDDDILRRYSFADGKWDGLALPGLAPFSQRILAVRGNRIAWFAQYGPNQDSIFLSRDRGGHFEYTAKVPKPSGQVANLLFGRGSEMVYLSFSDVHFSRNDGADWEPANPNSCKALAYPAHVAFGDSGLFLYEGGLWRIRDWAGDCKRIEITLPAEIPEGEVVYYQPSSAMAASGGSLYLGRKHGLWVWEDPSPTIRIIAKPNSARRNPAKGRFPVRVWTPSSNQGTGTSPGVIDARGVLRR